MLTLSRETHTTAGSPVRNLEDRNPDSPAASAREGRWCFVSGGCRGLCVGGLGKRVSKDLLLLLVERRLEDHAPGILDFVQYLIGRHMLDQHEQNRIAGFNGRRQLLHELIVDAEIGERAAERSRRRAEGNAYERIHEQQADQQPPEAPHGGARGGGVDQLIELDGIALRLDRDDRIANRDQIFALELQYSLPDFIGPGLGWIHNRNKV